MTVRARPLTLVSERSAKRKSVRRLIAVPLRVQHRTYSDAYPNVEPAPARSTSPDADLAAELRFRVKPLLHCSNVLVQSVEALRDAIFHSGFHRRVACFFGWVEYRQRDCRPTIIFSQDECVDRFGPACAPGLGRHEPLRRAHFADRAADFHLGSVFPTPDEPLGASGPEIDFAYRQCPPFRTEHPVREVPGVRPRVEDEPAWSIEDARDEDFEVRPCRQGRDARLFCRGHVSPPPSFAERIVRGGRSLHPRNADSFPPNRRPASAAPLRGGWGGAVRRGRGR